MKQEANAARKRMRVAQPDEVDGETRFPLPLLVAARALLALLLPRRRRCLTALSEARATLLPPRAAEAPAALILAGVVKTRAELPAAARTADR